MPMKKKNIKDIVPPFCQLCHGLFETRQQHKGHNNTFHRQLKYEMLPIKSLRRGENISLTSECKFCHKGLLNRHKLAYHYGKVHREQKYKKVWKCEFCKKEFKGDMHARTKRLIMIWKITTLLKQRQQTKDREIMLNRTIS